MTTPPGTTVQEYSIRVPKNVKKRYHVMRFNATLGVDFSKWTGVKMERENNMKEYIRMEDETPKFGAGSEFGKEAREEARRKKLGIIQKKYKPDDQPWILKVGGSTGKKFKGIREGGVSENAAYYVFTHGPQGGQGAIEAFPLQEWYKFQPIQRYKSLSAEEAEQEFGKRNKVMNYFSLMLRKRLKGDEEVDMDEGEEAKGKKNTSKKTKDLKISDMDEWMESSEDDSEENEAEEKEEDEEKEEKKKKAKKAQAQEQKKKKRDTDLEAFEDSDDGDNEGREMDYISDSSESEPEDAPNKALQGVSEEKALRKLLTSDEDSEEDEQKSDKEQSNEDEEEKKKDGENKTEDEKKKNKKKLKKKDMKKKKDEKAKDSSSDFSSDSTDSETENKKNKEQKKDEKEPNSAGSSRSASPSHGHSSEKRKFISSESGPSKKMKLDTSLSNYIPGSSESGITEDAVRRYLMRKPMTTTELLQKFKSKKTGLSSEQLVNIMTQILKKINPTKQTIKGKMYLSIKA